MRFNSIQLKAPVESITVAKEQKPNSTIAPEINQSNTNCGEPRSFNRENIERSRRQLWFLHEI